jgi:ornithine--oxo-acid transaminase
VREIRGKGLFVGVEFQSDKYAYDFSKKMLHYGVLAKPTQKNIIRFSPPLVMT